MFAALMTTSPLWAQVENESDLGSLPSGSEPMLTPAPVNDQSYSTEVGVGRKPKNFLKAGIIGTVGYIDNLYPVVGASAVPETLFVILPTVAVDMTTPRQQISASYSPGFTFYEPTSTLNEVDQTAQVSFAYRLSPYLNFNLSDTFVDSSTGFSQAGLGINTNVSGSAPAMIPGLYPPFGKRFINTARGDVSDQFSPHSMVGASGEFLKLDYPNLSEGFGLYNSDSRQVSGFFNERLSARQYLGANYQFENTFAYPPGTQFQTTTNTISAFYTIYLTESVSLSGSGGPQHFNATHSPEPPVSGWSPAFTVSGGWRVRQHVAVAGNFARTVGGGGGLLGAYHTTSTGLSGNWQMSPNWSSGASASYVSTASATPQLAPSSPGGNSFLASALLERRLFMPNLRARFQYDRIQQNYSQVQALAANPTSNRETVTLVWELTRPIGGR